ncbi:PAS domain S-box protein [Streptomyces sp. NPDC058052]|uniref:PAS domain-containing protein n=1 Tax=Streptomyces sp. NPDC058052 TaxID=3346316 RepID=UPI0036F0F1A5
MNFDNSPAVFSPGAAAALAPLPREDVVDFVPDAVLIVDDNGTVVRANLAAAALFGYDRQTVEGRGVLDFLPSFDWNLTRGPADTGHPGGTPAHRLRTTARTSGGTAFAAEITTVRLDRHAFHDSIPYGSSLVISLRDITEAEDARAALSHSLLQAEAVLRTTGEALVGIDTEGRIDLVNPAAARLLGGRAAELGGCELLSLLVPVGPDGEPLDAGHAPLAQALRTGHPSRLDALDLEPCDGPRLTADVSVRPVTDDGRVVGTVVALSDRRPYERLADEYVAAQARSLQHHRTELERQQRRTDRAVEHTRELADFLSGPLAGALHHLHTQLTRLADDGSRPLWPEATISLEALAADLRMTMALVTDRARPYPEDTTPVGPRRRTVLVDDVVQAGVRAAAAFTGPSRVQFSVHAPRFAVHVDPDDISTAVGRLIADVVHTGDEQAGPGPHHVFVAALHQRGLLRVEVRGPYSGGAREHFDVVQGIAAAHGGTLRTHRAAGVSGSTYVLELPSAVQDDAAPAAAPGDTSPAALRPTGRHRSPAPAYAAERLPT